MPEVPEARPDRVRRSGGIEPVAPRARVQASAGLSERLFYAISISGTLKPDPLAWCDFRGIGYGPPGHDFRTVRTGGTRPEQAAGQVGAWPCASGIGPGLAVFRHYRGSAGRQSRP